MRLRLPTTFFLLFCLLVVAACKQSVEFPLISDSQSPYFWVAGKIEGRTVNFVIDTGSSMPVISELLADELGLSADDSVDKLGREYEFPVVRLDNVTVGRLRLAQSSPFQIRDTSYLEVITGRKVDGIVGGGVLNAARYEIEFPSKSMRVGNLNVDTSAMSKLEIRNQYLYGEAVIDGEGIEFLIDSGSTFNEIRESDALKLVPNLDELETQSLNIARIDGHYKEDKPVLVVGSLQFGGAVLEDVRFYVGDRNILGINVLREGVLTVAPDQRLFKFELAR